MDVEVDKEYAHLEEEIFEVTKGSITARNYQWGLDSGNHQYL